MLVLLVLGGGGHMKWFPESKVLFSCACSEGTMQSVDNSRFHLAMIVVEVRKREMKAKDDGGCP